ncbi:MAG: hypothetical protein LUE94_21270, partial [Clostridiales bacterium]|nr:hypothetical protein [Clostridiales bacterium]
TNKTGTYIVTGIVDKRVEADRRGKSDIQLECNNPGFYTDGAGGIIQEGGADGQPFCGPDEPVRV